MSYTLYHGCVESAIEPIINGEYGVEKSIPIVHLVVICSNVLNVISNDIVLNELQNRIRNFSFSANLDKKTIFVLYQYLYRKRRWNWKNNKKRLLSKKSKNKQI